MSITHSRGARRVAAGLIGLLTVGAAGLMGASAAHAAPGNIDTTTPGSITIHKHLETGATSGANPDGTGTVAGPAVSGVEFTIYQLNYNGAPVDLTASNTWNGLSAITLDSACAVTSGGGYSRGSAVNTATTNSAGTITYATGTARSAYVVCETNVAGAEVNGSPVSIVSKAAPFVITVPLPYNDSWLYNVNAYPKNSSATVTKAVQAPSGYGLGSTVDFPVTTAVPVSAGNAALSTFIVADTLDTRLGSAQVKTVTIDGQAVNPTYYAVSSDAGNANAVRVTFNATGLTWLGTQGGKSIVVTFSGTVVSLGTGGIANQAVAYINDPNTAIRSNTVTTNWGDLAIRKADSGNNQNLTGATFQVYAADPAYPTAGGACTSKTTTGSAITVSGQNSFTTGAAGTVTVPGLYVSDSTNGPANAPSRCYVIVETAAPAGYTLPAGDAAKTAVTVNVGQTAAGTYGADVPNTKQLVPSLPLTGAAGQTIAVSAGAALLLSGAVLMVVRRRRHVAAQQDNQL